MPVGFQTPRADFIQLDEILGDQVEFVISANHGLMLLTIEFHGRAHVFGKFHIPLVPGKDIEIESKNPTFRRSNKFNIKILTWQDNGAIGGSDRARSWTALRAKAANLSCANCSRKCSLLRSCR